MSAGPSFTPPDIWNFPPFFTIQPVEATREKQLHMWEQLILSYHRSQRLFSMSLDSFPFFQNEEIERSLSMDDRRKVVDFMVGNGTAEWEDESTEQRCKVLWQSYEEWAAKLYQYASDRAMIDQVFTLDEIIDGDEAPPEFRGMDAEVFRRVADVLQGDGRAKVFSAGSRTGIKFFSLA